MARKPTGGNRPAPPPPPPLREGETFAGDSEPIVEVSSTLKPSRPVTQPPPSKGGGKSKDGGS